MKKKHIIPYLLVLALAIQACKTQQIRKNNSSIEKTAQKKSNGIFIPNTAQTYINTYKSIAVKEMNEYGIPASITLAQGILESNFGNSDLAKYANNHFGIKCTSTWKGQGYFKDDDQKNDCFRVYKDANESYRDHSEFLKRKRYAGLFQLDKNDYRGWARGLKEAGYATNPNYANLLINTIEKYDLTKFDQPDSERSKIARQDKIFEDINSEMAKEDAKYTPVENAPKGIVTTQEAEEKLEQQTNNKTETNSPENTIPIAGASTNDERVVYKASKPKTTPTSTPAKAINTEAETYTVQPGDGLYRIARIFSLSVDRLKEINNLNSDELQAGQILTVKDNGSIPVGNLSKSIDITTTKNIETKENKPAVTPPTETIPTDNGEVAEIETTSTYYTVQAGDTFYKIAKDFNTTVDEIKALNQANGDELKVGQEIKVAESKKNIYKPKAKKTPETPPSNDSTQIKTYTVEKGDSLYKISKKFNLTIDELKQLNSLSSDALQVGQSIKVSK